MTVRDFLLIFVVFLWITGLKEGVFIAGGTLGLKEGVFIAGGTLDVDDDGKRCGPGAVDQSNCRCRTKCCGTGPRSISCTILNSDCNESKRTVCCCKSDETYCQTSTPPSIMIAAVTASKSVSTTTLLTMTSASTTLPETSTPLSTVISAVTASKSVSATTLLTMTSTSTTLPETGAPLSTMISAVTASKPASTTTLLTMTSALTTSKPLPDYVTSHFETLRTKVVATAEITPTSTEPKAIATSSTLFSTASPTVSQSSKLNATERSRQYESRMQALNVSREDSLQEAAKISNTFFESLKNDPPEDNSINILVAAQQLDMFAIRYLKTHKRAKQTQVMSQKWFAMKVQQLRPNNKEAISFSLNETDFPTGETGIARISIPLAVFEGQEDAVVVSILYNGIEEWIPSIGNVRLENGATISNLTLGSRIVSSTVYPKPNGTLKENVTVVFSCSIDAEEEVTPHCVFWESDVKGYWSKRGCSLVKKIDNEITCSCNHLTNFAVLMQIGSNEVPSGHKDALEVITYVGCALSLVGEALAIVAYWILMNLKEEQIQIRFNLVVAIGIAQITFLAGIEASALQGLCIFVAGLIHYFYLVAFAWMLFEGVYLYLMVVKVFNTEIKMRLFYAVAWGLPLLIVLLSMLIASTQDGGIQGYVHGDFCWVSFTNNLIWTFVTPVLVVCSINTVLLGRVVNEIVKMQSGKTSEVEKVRKGVKACAVLFPLLGLTWVFGILSVTDAGLVFQYIFTILNSLQGLFIFILHVLRNADVRAAYFRKKKNWKVARSIGPSHTANHDSIALGSSNMRSERPDSRSKSYCTSPRSERSVIGYDKPFAFDHDRCMTPVDT